MAHLENEMTKNVGLADRILRIIFGSALLILAIVNPQAPYSYGGLVGVLLLATGLFGWCGLYRLLSYSTLTKTGA